MLGISPGRDPTRLLIKWSACRKRWAGALRANFPVAQTHSKRTEASKFDVIFDSYIVSRDGVLWCGRQSKELVLISNDPPSQMQKARRYLTVAHYGLVEESRIPISFQRSHSAPIPTVAPDCPLISLISNNSYSLPKARKWAKSELK